VEKAQNLTEKIKDSAVYINEDQVLQRYNNSQSNPFQAIEGDLNALNQNIKDSIRTHHPFLSKIAQYYFDLKGKRIRPVLIFLVARAMSHHVANNSSAEIKEQVLPGQSRLAEIVEMIHTASLVHDDVLDGADMRRSVPSINVAFGNKVSILAGDFLLARASIVLAELQNFEVTQLMSRVLSDLVEGEFMQLSKGSTLDFEYYIQKTYYKTASLIANGCRAVVVLAGLPREFVEVATTFGKHFGLAFQLIDDLLDFIGNKDEAGKPIGNDIKLGIATAPALYAVSEFPELKKLIERNFSQEGDVEKAYDLVLKSSGIEKTRKLAQEHIQMAKNSLSILKDSKAKQGLLDLAEMILNRTK